MTLFALTLLQATAACLLSGWLLQGVLSLALRRWPALAAQRSAWLGAQLVLAAAFVLPLLPDTHQLSVVPGLSMPLALASAAPALPLAVDVPAASRPSAAAWLALVSAAWGLIYLLGVAGTAWRWQRGRALLRALLQVARRRRLCEKAVIPDAAHAA